eukprot:Unigene2049_Nuclearia_a/m.6374 Unigene2049_Nuclearia_a/g.6374  ORF Unigene2049_Nuclearia_a/g.6374 Unigene2049_Nuclearia_a/m.6374 type:complete len:589 (+) Unigene2049_Nuclearia_a:424-2190(+)
MQLGAQAAQRALGHDADALAQHLGLLHRVRREDDGLANTRLVDDVPDQPAHLRVEARRRLVQEDDLAVADQRNRDRQPALLATRQAARLAEAEARERDAREGVVDGRLLLLRLDALEARVEVQVLLDRELGPQDVVLRAHAHAPVDRIHLFADFVASQEAFAVRRLVQAREDANQRRLAGAVRTEQAKDEAALDSERDALDGQLAAVELLHVAKDERAVGRVVAREDALALGDHVLVLLVGLAVGLHLDCGALAGLLLEHDAAEPGDREGHGVVPRLAHAKLAREDLKQVDGHEKEQEDGDDERDDRVVHLVAGLDHRNRVAGLAQREGGGVDEANRAVEGKRRPDKVRQRGAPVRVEARRGDVDDDRDHDEQEADQQCVARALEEAAEQERHDDLHVAPQEKQEHVDARRRQREERQAEDEARDDEHGRADDVQDVEVDVLGQPVHGQLEAVHLHHHQDALLLVLDQVEQEDRKQERDTKRVQDLADERADGEVVQARVGVRGKDAQALRERHTRQRRRELDWRRHSARHPHTHAHAHTHTARSNALSVCAMREWNRMRRRPSGGNGAAVMASAPPVCWSDASTTEV